MTNCNVCGLDMMVHLGVQGTCSKVQGLQNNADISYREIYQLKTKLKAATDGWTWSDKKIVELKEENAELKEDIIELKGANAAHINVEQERIVDALEQENAKLKRQLETAKADRKKIDEQSRRIFKANGLLKAEMRICPYCKG